MVLSRPLHYTDQEGREQGKTQQKQHVACVAAGVAGELSRTCPEKNFAVSHNDSWRTLEPRLSVAPLEGSHEVLSVLSDADLERVDPRGETFASKSPLSRLDGRLSLELVLESLLDAEANTRRTQRSSLRPAWEVQTAGSSAIEAGSDRLARWRCGPGW